MAHPAAGRGRHARNEADDWLVRVAVLHEPLRCLFLLEDGVGMGMGVGV